MTESRGAHEPSAPGRTGPYPTPPSHDGPGRNGPAQNGSGRPAPADNATISAMRTFLPVVGDAAALAAAFEADPRRWLPAAARDPERGTTMVVRAGSLRRTVAVEIGVPRRAGDTRWRSLAWEPVAGAGGPTTIDRLLPRFAGELGLHVPADGPSTLVLDGSYRPPGGPLGARVDAVGLRRVASATVRRVLQDVAGALSAEAVLVTPS